MFVWLTGNKSSLGEVKSLCDWVFCRELRSWSCTTKDRESIGSEVLHCSSQAVSFVTALSSEIFNQLLILEASTS